MVGMVVLLTPLMELMAAIQFSVLSLQPAAEVEDQGKAGLLLPEDLEIVEEAEVVEARGMPLAEH